MSDTYQPIYDAVRSRLGPCGSSEIESAVRQCFEWAGYLQPHAQQEIYRVSDEHTRPSVLFRPAVYPDGDQWCALYGGNLQEGVAGFGDTPDAAVRAFDEAWTTDKRSAA